MWSVCYSLRIQFFCYCWLNIWTHLGIGLGLAVTAVTVVVGTKISIFMNSVQKPEEELESIMLRVSPKLRGILCHCSLRRGDTSKLIPTLDFKSHYLVT